MKFPKRLIVALALLLIGAIGLPFALKTDLAPAEKVVARYISAINSANGEKMQKCELDLSSYLGMESSAPEVDTVAEALDASCIYSLPAQGEVTGLRLLGCTTETFSDYGMEGAEVTALLEVTFLDGEGQTRTLLCQETFELIQQDSKFFIVGY